MTAEAQFADFSARLREFIQRSAAVQGAAGIQEFEPLALELFALQSEHNAAYRRFCASRGAGPATVHTWRDIPAVPAAAFKELELTSLPPPERTTVFFSSGTTEQRRSRHFHAPESLRIYEASLLPWFERHLLADVNDLVEEQWLGPVDKLPMLALTPTTVAVPNSSLVHMFATVQREFGARDSLFSGRVEAEGNWTLDLDATLFAIRKSMSANRPLLLLGTAFNFVHLLDHFAANNMRYRLARGSRVLETGGYKGQSRIVPKPELHALIAKHLGIAPEYIVTEYGMSELSAQAYNRVAGKMTVEQAPSAAPDNAGEGSRATGPSNAFHFPPWARAMVVSPETGLEVAEGESGLLRIYDLANVRSVMAIQTEDLAVKRGDGFELVGRAERAEPRGCSLMSGSQMTPG